MTAPIELNGPGLFTEKPARARVSPAEPGSGIRFVRTDLPGAPEIPATIGHLSTTPIHPAFAQMPARNTVLVSPHDPRAVVVTTEHVLSALAGLGLWNATVELDGPELPIGDGSSLALAAALHRSGWTTAPAEPIVLTSPVTVRDGDASISAEPLDAPDESPRFEYGLDYGDRAPLPAELARQSATWDGSPESYLTTVAPARTFCLAMEAEAMRAAGLFQQFTPRDLLVLAPDGPVENELRFKNEPAAHKLLDVVGDLALLGRPLRARITATRSGHALNHALARAILDAG